MTQRSRFPFPSSASRLLAGVATVLAACLPVCTGAAALWTLAPVPAALAVAGSTLDRPTFDRANDVILVPYHGALPRFETETSDNGTRLSAIFSGSQARISAPYKLGVFHPVVSRVEMTPMPEAGQVQVSIVLNQPGSLNIQPDPRRGMMRLAIAGPIPEDRLDLSTPVDNGFLGLFPKAAGGARQGPAPGPSVPPVRLGSANPSNPLSGTPAGGDYIYRKAIPAANGNDVTEVMVRSDRMAAIDIDRASNSDAVVVNVVPPGGNRPPTPDGWVKPAASEPWRQPAFRGEVSFKPVAAIDSVVGYTLMSESAASLGSTFSGSGATLYGGGAHIPMGGAFNLNLAGETFAYTVTSAQIPDSIAKRNEYFGSLGIEYLPVRRPWVLATGLGYWGRYMTTKNNVLPPADPSMLFSPSQLWHGPALNSRVYVPLPMWESLALAAEVGVAPYMLSGSSDDVATALGTMLGYQGLAAVKWSNRHVSMSVGYRHQGYSTYNQAMSSSRGGPEVSLVWRF